MSGATTPRWHSSRAVAALAIAGLVPVVESCTQTVRVGAVVSRTGAASVYGERIRKGLDLAASEVDGDGGDHGPRIELLLRDDATHPDVGAQAVLDLIDHEHVGIVIGAVSSAVTLRIAPLCESRHVVLLSPSASAPSISDAGEYVFRNFPSDLLEGTSMADFALDLGLDRVVVFSVANEYGASLRKAFLDRFESPSRKALGAFNFAEGDSTGFDVLVRRVQELRPRGVYIAGFASDTGEILRRLRAAGVGAIVLGTSSVQADLVRSAGAVAENLVFPQPAFDPESNDPAVRRFVEAYRASYGEDPDVYAAHGYDALRIVRTAIARAGSAAPDRVRKALLESGAFDAVAGRTAFDANGDVVRYARIFVVRDGKPVPFDRFVERGGVLPVPGR